MIEIYKKHLPHLLKASGYEWKSICPFHEEKTPSFYVNEVSGFFYCFGCGESGGIVKFLDRIGASEEKDGIVKVEFEKALSLTIEEGISPIVIEQMHANLMRDQQRLAYLVRNRKLSYIVIKRYVLGWDTASERYAIPIKSRSGKFSNIKLHNSDKIPKSFYWRSGSARLYPISAINHNQIIICEGEFDCLALHSLGLNAITSTSGAGANKWNEAWNSYFAGKEVKIIYDTDSAGRAGAENVKNNLEKWTRSVEIITLPSQDSKVDVTDFLVSGGNIWKLLHQRKKI